jgi:hypothetical protein
MTAPSGAAPAPASLSPPPAAARGKPTSGTCGPSSAASSHSVDRPLSSGNKLLANPGARGCPAFGMTLSTTSAGRGFMKTCTSCARKLSRGAFRRYCGRSSDGLRPICKECQRIYEARWRGKNLDVLTARRQARADKEKVYRQSYDAANRGRLLVMEAGRRARRRNLPFDLHEHIQEVEVRIQAGCCEMTGLPFNFHAAGVQWNSPSLDRIIPERGYVLSNIRIVLFAMNAALGNWGEDTLRTIISAWLEES